MLDGAVWKQSSVLARRSSQSLADGLRVRESAASRAIMVQLVAPLPFFCRWEVAAVFHASILPARPSKFFLQRDVCLCRPPLPDLMRFTQPRPSAVIVVALKFPREDFEPGMKRDAAQQVSHPSVSPWLFPQRARKI